MLIARAVGNLRHLPFFGSGETWETYEAKFEEAVSWLEVRNSSPWNTKNMTRATVEVVLFG